MNNTHLKLLKRIGILGVFLSCFSIGFCQKDTVFIRYNNSDGSKASYRTDTVLFSSNFDRAILHGTMVLPGHELQVEGLNLFDAELIPCRNDVEGDSIPHNEIVNIHKKDSVITIETKVYSNCCFSFLCQIEQASDSILNIEYNDYGRICNCGCCFGLIYRIRIEDESTDYKRLKGIEMNGDKKTFKSMKGL